MRRWGRVRRHLFLGQFAARRSAGVEGRNPCERFKSQHTAVIDHHSVNHTWIVAVGLLQTVWLDRTRLERHEADVAPTVKLLATITILGNHGLVEAEGNVRGQQFQTVTFRIFVGC